MSIKVVMLPSSDCGWSGCGQPGPVEVLVAVHGKPAGLTCPLGCYCIGHAVICGIDAQARHGGRLWYRPRSPMTRHATTTN